MSNERLMRIYQKDQGIYSKIGRYEVPITQPSPLPRFITRGVMEPIIRRYQEVFPTCSQEIKERSDIDFCWQTMSGPIKAKKGTPLNEAVTDILAGYAFTGSKRDQCKATRYSWSLNFLTPKIARVGRTILRVLGDNHGTPQTMKILGEAYFSGDINQFINSYEQNRDESDPDFESFYKSDSVTRLALTLSPFTCAKTVHYREKEKPQVIFYASQLGIVPFAGFLMRQPLVSTALAASLFSFAYHRIAYHEIAHALSYRVVTESGWRIWFEK